MGWHARLGAAALGLFCLATAILFHTNFANRNELLHFEKDLAIAGGMFVLMLRGAGGYSVQAFARQKEAMRGLAMACPGFLNWWQCSNEEVEKKKATDRPSCRYNQVRPAPGSGRLTAPNRTSESFRADLKRAAMTSPKSDDNSVLLVHAYLDGGSILPMRWKWARMSNDPALAAEGERSRRCGS